MDSIGNVYVFDAGNHRVVVFDEDGNETGGWGERGSGDGQFESLGFGGLAIDSDDSVYVVDNGNHRIQKFSTAGTFVTAWGEMGDGNGGFKRPIGIAASEGEVFVTDDEVPFVQVFDSDGQFLRQFGGPGDQPGQFLHATGIEVDRSGDVWVADYDAQRVQRFRPDGSVDGVWQNPAAAGSFQTPEGIEAVGDTILVSSYGEGEVQILPGAAGSSEEWQVAGGAGGFGDGLFLAPVDLAVAPDGGVYVADQRSNTVQRLVG